MNSTPSFLILKAGAGSGKTFNLVKQFLSMAFAASNEQQLETLFRSILAITFTNKAANEMKGRIVSTLIALSQGRPNNMAEMLCQELHIDSAELQRRAKIVSNAILHNYSDLSVCTIDSFMQRLVRTFARDLQLPLNFNIEPDDKYISSILVDQLMALVGTEGEEDLTDVLCAYSNTQMEDGKSYNVESLLHETATSLFKESAAEYIQLLERYSPQDFKQAHEKLKQDNRNFLETCKAQARAAIDICHANGINEEGKYLKSIYNWLVKIRDCGNTLPDLKKTEQKIYNNGTVDGKGKCPHDVEQAILQAVTTFVEGAKIYATRRKLMGCYFKLGVLGALQRLRETYYHDNELTDFTEISHKINAVVQESPAPYLYERLGDRYRYFLIDEFQDTSQEQWSNLLPLINNGVAAGYRSLIVGDAKQAIYRFRQGDVRQFLALAQLGDTTAHSVDTTLQNADLSLLAQVSETVQLSTNYRTLPTVVQFNNRFFAWLISTHYGDNALLQEIYSDAGLLLKEGIKGAPRSFAQLSPEGKEGGCVQIAFYSKKKESESANPLFSTAYEMIKRQQSLGYIPGNITVLANENKTLSEFSAFLSERGLRSASSESMLLSSSTVVRLLHSLLHHLLHPNERLHQLHVLHYMWQLGMVPDTYKEQFQKQEKQLASGDSYYSFLLQDYLQQQGFSFDTRRLQRMPLYELCEELLRIFRLEGTESMFTASLLNFVARYSDTHRQSLGEFLDYFERKWEKLSSNTPTDRNAIQLMTVHKSKGLEATIIIYLLPKADDHNSTLWLKTTDSQLSPIDVALVQLNKNESTLFDKHRDAEQQEKEMDNINRTYVAFTRPKDKLLLVVEEHLPAKDAKEPPRSLNNRLYQYAMECVNSNLCHKETEQDLFLFGSDDPKPIEKENADTEQQESLPRLSFPSWQQRIIVAANGNAQRSTALQESIHRGVELHDLLAHIHHADDLDRAISHYARLHACNDEHTEELRRACEQLLRHPATASFFTTAGEVKTECSLCYRGSTLRPDRMVLLPDETWVIDFKTGSPLTTHADQVSNYCSAMRAMNYPNVSGYLIYIGNDEPQVVPVG